MKKALILMTRVPIPGQTKTRLMTILSKQECANIHFCFLKDIFEMYEYIKDEIDLYLTYTPKEEYHIIKDFIPSYIKTFEQKGDTLGDRMKYAINKVLEKGYDKVVLTGCDIPQIQRGDVNKAFDNLDNSDVVIGPTLDGGYYLVGMKKSIDIIFDTEISWGEMSVLEGTIEICNQNNITTSLSNKLMDIDTKEDLFDLYEDIQINKFKHIPKHTYKFIEECNIYVK